MSDDPGAHRGLLVDFGGVLTTSVARSFRRFCRDLGIEPELVKDTFLEAYDGPDGESPVHLVETGRISGAQFAGGLAEILSRRSGIAIEPDGLIERLFAGVSLDEAMLAGVAAARRAGVRTGLLSNSWGDGPQTGYPRERFGELFDAVVISGEVGLRKPDPRIFTLAAQRLGLVPAACVFVDDVAVNVAAAEALGMAGVAHRDAEQTLHRVAGLLGLDAAVLTS